MPVAIVDSQWLRLCLAGVESWDETDRAHYFRLLGLALERQSKEGTKPDITQANYLIARELVEDEREAASFGDDLETYDQLREEIFDRVRETLVWMRWESRTGDSDGVMLLDFGTGKAIVARPPNEDDALWDWEPSAIVDPSDASALRSIILDYIRLGQVPDEIHVAAYVSRDDVAKALNRALDSADLNDWGILSDWFRWRPPHAALPVETEEQRAACLRAYLDKALTIEAA